MSRQAKVVCLLPGSQAAAAAAAARKEKITPWLVPGVTGSPHKSHLPSSYVRTDPVGTSSVPETITADVAGGRLAVGSTEGPVREKEAP